MGDIHVYLGGSNDDYHITKTSVGLRQSGSNIIAADDVVMLRDAAQSSKSSSD